MRRLQEHQVQQKFVLGGEYNHSVSSALKNTLDYFLEEYFFKPSAIVSYSVGGFGGNMAGAPPRQIFSEICAPSISSSFL